MSPLVSPLLRTFDYAGRSRRMELWPFAGLVAMLWTDALLWDVQMGRSVAVAGLAGPLTIIVGILVLLPLGPLVIRRLHDTGRSGAWMALLLLPVVGAAWLVGLLAVQGDVGANRFGADPQGRHRRPLLAGLFVA